MGSFGDLGICLRYRQDMAKKREGKALKSKGGANNASSSSDTLKVGSAVRMSESRTVFEIVEGPNSRNEYLIATGALRMWMSRDELSPQATKPSAKSTTKHSPEIEYSEAGTQVDLHGLTVAEAKTALEIALDNALQRNLDHIDIVHGVGTGKLRSAVQEYLSNSKHIKRFALIPENRGTTRAYL